MRSITVFLVAVLFAGPAVAHDMDEPYSDWYRSLKVPGDMGNPLAGTSCCNGGADPDPDCRNVETRVRDGHWQAFIDSLTFPDVPPPKTPGFTNSESLYGHAPNDWVDVPENVIIRRENPTGGPVACWYNRVIRCFVLGTQT